MSILRARYLWASARRLYSPGELVVGGDGRVAYLGPSRSGRVPERAILPGLVNAHVHLQIPPLGQRPVEFLDWVRQVMSALRASTGELNRERARRALAEIVSSGVTAVGEVDSTGDSPPALREMPVAGRCYQEVTGFHLEGRAAHDLVARRSLPGSPHCPRGLSPHAPYSASASVFRAARRSGVPLSVHVAETREEQRFLRRGDGGFRALLEELARLPRGFRAPGVGAVAWLERLGVLGPRTALIHCQHLESGDAARIRSGGATIVVCPGTIAWFRREPPDVPAWLASGIPVALGTDSSASNTRLSMMHEISLARRFWPQIPPPTLLSMATAHGARALARPGLGSLRQGSRADCVLVGTAGCRDAEEVLERFTAGSLEIAATYLQGRRASFG